MSPSKKADIVLHVNSSLPGRPLSFPTLRHADPKDALFATASYFGREPLLFGVSGATDPSGAQSEFSVSGLPEPPMASRREE